jgi:lipopolysaccharide biosynthesis protein
MPADALRATVDGSRARVLAFHLPQFHPIPENDLWWGPGFTEWTNTAKARPRYPGHYQPHVPADLGFYDLRLPECRLAQADLARSFGVAGFVYWHYWFGHGRRILERPVDEVVSSGEPDFPFALAWANQTWSGIWHGAPNRVLIEQHYPGPDDERAHFEHILPALTDPRYITVDGKPLFYIFRPELLPEPARFVEHWQDLAVESGFPGLFLAAESSDLLGAGPVYVDAARDGFDATVYMRMPADESRMATLGGRVSRKLRIGEVLPYRSQPWQIPALFDRTRTYNAVYPNWDNSPRSGSRSVILHGSTPERFRAHVRQAVDDVQALPIDRRLVFVKSWNEWAEGNHLEPDGRFGTGYLEAIRDEVQMHSSALAGR